MRSAIFLCFFSLNFLLVTSTLAQNVENPMDEDPFAGAAPFGAPRRVLGASELYSLSNLATAKYTEVAGKPSLIFLVEQFRKQKQEFTFTVMKQEQRTRNVKIVRDGKEETVEQNYVVNVPVKEKRDVMRNVSAGIKPATVPMTELSLYRLDGSEVSADDASKLLETAQAIFVVRGNLKKIPPPTKLAQQVLKPNTLVAVTAALPAVPRQNAIRWQPMADPFGN
jgi:hypothetical protein